MYIVVTQPLFFEGEAEHITLMFQAGLQRLHLRKPGSSIDECRALLRAIPRCYHPRIALHDHYGLVDEFDICRIHLTARNTPPPAKVRDYAMSTSCHSLEELRQNRHFNYLSLSPIFDSISKVGYKAAFTREELLAARDEGIINEDVMALGGISWENAEQMYELGFGGVMVLGDAWRTDELPVVLSIAGSDPSAGAGIQQDLKTITNCDCYGTTVITALTAQNTLGVQSVQPVSAEMVDKQMDAVFADMRVAAVKLGIIPNIEVAKVITDRIRREQRRRILPVVLDPVMFSTSGTRLMSEECIAYVAKELFPLCALVTPNIPEYEHLVRLSSDGKLQARAYLLKGGHSEGEETTDTLFLQEEGRRVDYAQKKILSTNLHGTGCTLSSAIACELARYHSLETAVVRAKAYVTQAIEGGKDLRLGHGNGPLWLNVKTIQ